METNSTGPHNTGPHNTGLLSAGPPRRANEPSRWQKAREFGYKVGCWLPVVLVAGIIVYGLYVYIVEYCFLTLIQYDPPQTVKAVLYLVSSITIAVLLAISYGVMTFRSPGHPTDFALRRANDGESIGWGINDSSKGKRTYVLPSTEDDKYCGICDTPKPERCHHCSVCGLCILKMDHHCPWFNNCVGYRNYKFFILSLFYGLLLCVLIFATLLQELIWELVNDRTEAKSVQFLIICIFAFMLGMSSAALFFYHVFLLSWNMTTLEQITRAEDKAAQGAVPPHPYNVGVYRNICSVMGGNILVWLIPWPYAGPDRGLQFPRRPSNRIENV